MIAEQDRVKEAREDFKKEREFCKNVILKSEVYERLGASRDHSEFLDDIRAAVEAHKKNISVYVKALGIPTLEGETEHPVFRRLRIAELIAHHQTKVDALEEVLSLGERTASAKEQAMIRLNDIDKEEKEMPR